MRTMRIVKKKKSSLLPKTTHLEHVKIKHYADYSMKSSKGVITLKKSCYRVVDGYSITGEAPKSFIKVYDSTRGRTCRKNKIKTWTLYIAKTGSKWYPVESITEHLIARIGTTLGLNMAYSQLVNAGGQIRFLSKYFLTPEQELVHASSIMTTYLGDRDLILHIEKQKLEKEFFTLEETISALKTCFPDDQELILERFFLMLFFDAWVGVQDRHFYNWGVVRHINNKHRPYFSPIYDSARGLFWNDWDKKIDEWKRYKQFEQQIEVRSKKSEPQFCLSNKSPINHFDLVEFIWKNGLVKNPAFFKATFSFESLKTVQEMILSEFSTLLSKSRLELILRCLKHRHEKLYAIMTHL